MNASKQCGKCNCICNAIRSIYLKSMQCARIVCVCVRLFIFMPKMAKKSLIKSNFVSCQKLTLDICSFRLFVFCSFLSVCLLSFERKSIIKSFSLGLHTIPKLVSKSLMNLSIIQHSISQWKSVRTFLTLFFFMNVKL